MNAAAVQLFNQLTPEDRLAYEWYALHGYDRRPRLYCAGLKLTLLLEPVS